MNEQLKIIISAEIDKLKANVDKAKKEVEGFKEKVEKESKSVDESFKEMGSKIKHSLSTAGLAIAGAGAALVALGASTADYRAEQAKLQTAFEAAGSSAETAKTTYNDLYRVLGDSGKATEAAAHLAKLTTNEKDLAEWTNICQGIYATFGDSLPIEGLTEAANETAKVGTVTGGLADALNWAGINEDEFNEKLAACNSEAEREKLIRQTLNGVYDDAAKKYEKNNAEVIKQNESQAKLEETTAKLGKTLAPVVVAFTELATDALSALEPYIKDLAEKYLPKLKDVLKKAGEFVADILGFISEHWGLIVTLGSIIAGVAAAIGLYNAVAAVKATMDRLEVSTIWQLVAAYAAKVVAMGAAIAPYLLIVAAIAAVIAIIVLCIKYWDEIVAAVKKAWEVIKDAVKKGVEALGKFFSQLWETIKQLFGSIGAWFSEKFNQAVAGIKNAFASVGNFFKGVWQGVKNAFSGVKNWFSDTFGQAWAKVKAVFSAGGEIFVNIKNGILDGFKSVVNGLIRGINTVIALPLKGLNGILDTIQNISFLGISPFTWLSWRIPIPEIPQLAMGGVVDSATLAVIGERGDEMIMPLENNLGYLDKLAELITARMGGGNKQIVLNVDGKVFAETSINTINELTRQRGSLALNIV